MKNEKGQILVVVLLILVIAATLVPVMVLYTMRQSNWTNGQTRSTHAFHLAESGIEKGYYEISVATLTWVNLQKGTLISGFQCDTAYTDVTGGRYCVSITSGPSTQEATITSIGIDSMSKQVRAIQAVYANSVLSNIGIQAANGVDMSGNNDNVEWGAIVSPKAITINSKSHPTYWSAGSIDKDTNGASPPNCDQPNCYWWHSYYSNIPPMPAIDFSFYKSSAIASGTDPCGYKYYIPASSTPWTNNCNDSSGKPRYVEGDWTSYSSAIVGTIIITGSMSWSNGSQPSVTSYNATLPPQAWKQYCNDWSAYTAYDGSFPFSGCTTTPTGYQRTGITSNISPSIHGLLYVGGNFSIPNGGGNSDLLHGVIIIQGTANISTNSHGHIYYDQNAASNVQTTTILLSRQSWQDVLVGWPSGL